MNHVSVKKQPRNGLVAVLCLTLCPLGNFACFLSSADVFQNQLFGKNLSGIPLIGIERELLLKLVQCHW